MRTFRAGFLFCGLGAGARGFLRARAQLGPDVARFESVGGIDIDPEACADFRRLTGSPAVVADVATLSPGQLKAEWGDTAPDCVFLSPPCKGFSGLLTSKAAAQPEYQRLNELVLQGLFLLCETWPSAPPATIALENVPRIVSRGAELLTRAKKLLHQYGYVTHEGTHECGEIGGLAQKRRRFLLVARRPAAIPSFIYRPPKKRIRGCGEVLSTLPLPVDGQEAGPMHILPRLNWLTWVRLALIPPGGDWRDLPGVVQAGHQRRSVWARNDVRGWDDPARTVAGDGGNGGFGVADPRLFALSDKPNRYRNQHNVRDWNDPAGTVTGATRPGSGGLVVADPRIPESGTWRGSMGVVGWDDPSPTIRGQSNVRTSPTAVADPRIAEAVGLKRTAEGAGSWKGRPGLMAIADWTRPTTAVTASGNVSGSNATAAVADPRLTCHPWAGAYGVIGWEDAAATVTGSARVDNGAFAVADPRKAPAVSPIIRSAWECWHRPMSTLELAALQCLPTTLDGEPLVLAGRSIGRWRERIGNAVPADAAEAIGSSILAALLAAAVGTWTLGSEGVWVRDDGRTEHEWQAEP